MVTLQLCSTPQSLEFLLKLSVLIFPLSGTRTLPVQLLVKVSDVSSAVLPSFPGASSLHITKELLVQLLHLLESCF